MPKLGPTFALYVKMLLGFGAIFQMPVLVFALARMGIVTAGFLIRNTKYAVLIIFILGAVLSPGGDIPSQMIAGPMLVLYGISIIIAWVFQKRKPAAGAGARADGCLHDVRALLQALGQDGDRREAAIARFTILEAASFPSCRHLRVACRP